MMSFALRLVAFAIALVVGAASASACGPDDPCMVDGGHYLVRAPSGWDGRSPLPAVMFFHGWRESADAVMRNEDLIARLDKAGALLIAPHGEGNTWSYPGSPGQYRNEFVFVDAVLDDVAKRFPIDRKRLIASGFSQGASMVWNLACHRGERFAGFAPIAGAFWRPLPTACESGPVNLRHIHGTNDSTVPMAGRALRDGAFRQGDVRVGLKLFLDNNACSAAPATAMEDGLQCEIWRDCGSRREISLCLHPGGHDLDARWVEDAVRWIDGIAKSTSLK